MHPSAAGLVAVRLAKQPLDLSRGEVPEALHKLRELAFLDLAVAVDVELLEGVP